MPARAQSGKIIAIDWDARALRVVHATVGKRGPTIDRLLSAEIPGTVSSADPAQMGGHIRRVLDQEHIKTRAAIVDIPRDQAILKSLELPKANPGDLPGMVEIQIARELPFPASEAVIDFVANPVAGADSTSVLVAAVRREVLEYYETVFRHAGLRLERVGLRPFANQVAVAELLKHAVPEHVLFIDVGPALTEIDVLRHGVLAFSRAASVVVPRRSASAVERGGLRLTLAAQPPLERTGGEESWSAGGGAGDSVLQALAVEVMRSIEAYRTMDAGANIDHIVIGGESGMEEALAESLQKRLNVTTQLYNPATSFGWEPDEGVAAAAFASTLGLVLSHPVPSERYFDFLHPKRTESQARKRLRKAPVAAAIAILFISAAGIVVAGVTRPQRQELAELEASIEELRGMKDDHQKLLALMTLIREYDSQQLVWVDVLYDIFSVMPTNQQIVLTKLEMKQKERRVDLTTKTRDRDTALDVVKKLEEFRREGRDRPRYEARAGQQSERKGEKYPFQQDLRITVLNDEPPKKGASAPRG